MTQLIVREKEVTLLDLLDRALYKGIVLYGDITISVANVDLVYLGVRLLVTSIERLEEMRRAVAEEFEVGCD
jgi:hypothetical protein